MSPIGLAVAIFPAIVHTFLIWTDPYLFNIWLKSEKYFFIKDSKFIYICLENNINDQIIKDLIHLGYSYDDDDMQFALSNKKISLLRDMCNSYNRKDQ